MFDVNYTNPTVDSIAEIFAGPIVAVSMFAKYDAIVPYEATAAIHKWRTQGNRTNIRLIHGRTHVEVLGECSTDNHSGAALCLNAETTPAEGRQPRAGRGTAHRQANPR